MARPTFRAEARGAVAIEFALLLPVMIAMLFGSVSAANLVRASMKVWNVAQALGDLVAQQTSLSTAQMTDFCKGGALTLAPLTGALSATVASVTYATTGTRVVNWQDTTCGGHRDRQCPGARRPLHAQCRGQRHRRAGHLRLQLPAVLHPAVLVHFHADHLFAPAGRNRGGAFMTAPHPHTGRRDAMAILGAFLRGVARSGFRDDRRGGVAVWFGIGAVALLFFAGSGVDLARAINQQAEIQGAADAAALAGAGAYTGPATLAAATAAATNYMAQFKTASGLTGLTYTVTPGTNTSSGSVSVYTMTVKASATIANTLMAMASKSTTVAVTATAQNPVYNITITMAGFSSSAVDTNTISYYTVPADGSVPTSTTLLYSNAANSTATSGSQVVKLTASQKLGFMLTNTTDGNAVKTCTLSNDASSRVVRRIATGTTAYGGSAEQRALLLLAPVPAEQGGLSERDAELQPPGVGRHRVQPDAPAARRRCRPTRR